MPSLPGAVRRLRGSTSAVDLDAEPGRAFLRERVGLFNKANFLISGAFFLAGVALVALVATPAAGDGLRLGFARRTITPEVGGRPVYLAGFDTDRRATGVHDDLWARAVAASDGKTRLVIVAVDLIGLFHADVEKARALLRERAGDVSLVVTSTHDHEAPDTLGLWGPSHFRSGVDPRYLGRVRRTVSAVAEEALGRLEPARLLLAKTRTPGLVVDSRLPEVIDDTLLVMQGLARDGRSLGTVVVWSSHPEALGGRNTLVTADYVHYLRRRMEESLGGTSIFLVGSIGGLMTPLGLKVEEGGRPVPPETFRHARAVGERVAAAAVAALRASPHPSETEAVEYRSARVFVPLENRLFRLAAFLGVVDRPLFSRGEPATSAFGEDLETEVGHLRLGDAEGLCVPGEVYPEIVFGGIPDPPDPGADFPGAPREGPILPRLHSDFPFVLGLANDEIGYVIPRSEWDAKPPYAYGRREAPYGEVNSVGPRVAPILVRALETLLKP
jgi:hypothetical protein